MNGPLYSRCPFAWQPLIETCSSTHCDTFPVFAFAGGPVLKYEVNFGDDDLVKAKADWKIKGNEARMELQPKISPK